MFNRAGMQALRILGRYAGFWIAAAVGLFLIWIVWTSNGTIPNRSSFTPEAASAFLDSMQFEKGRPLGSAQSFGSLQWQEIASDSKVRLWMQADTGQIAITDRQSGVNWLSNPASDDPVLEETKGIWRSNLSSPFLFSFLEAQKTTPTYSNPADQKATLSWRKIDRGVGILYTMERINIRVYIEYQLEQGELVAKIPAHGVQDHENNRMLTLDLLPYFGAAKSGSQGYLLVPDGPGGIIDFAMKREGNISPYSQPVYGNDPAVTSKEATVPRSPIAYPVFGMNKDNAGWIGIIEAGATKANIVASAAGINTSYFQSNASFRLREYYWQPTGLFNGENVYEESLMVGEMKVRYIPLSGRSSDYVGMAQTYRDYLMKKQQVQKLQADGKSAPVSVEFVVSTEKSTPFGEKTVVMTSFEEVNQIVTRLESKGLKELKIGLSGWQDKGMPGNNPKLFPVEEEAGGQRGLKKLVGQLQGRGHKVSLTMMPNIAMDRNGSDFSARQEGVRNINGSIYKGRFWRDNKPVPFYLIDPAVIHNRYVPQLLEKVKPFGVNDVFLQGLGSSLYSNYDYDQSMTREQSLEYSRDSMKQARQAIGGASANTGFDYMLGAVDHIHNFQTSYNYDLLIDEQVPFYPIAIHGLTTYDGGYSNTSSDPETEWLRSIEYGALPAFLVSQADPRMMKQTYYQYLYSSQIDVLADRLIEEYEAARRTQDGVWNAFILDHNKLDTGIYETIYEDGRRVIVNYNDQPYTGYKGIRVEPKSYGVVQGGGNP